METIDKGFVKKLKSAELESYVREVRHCTGVQLDLMFSLKKLKTGAENARNTDTNKLKRLLGVLLNERVKLVRFKRPTQWHRFVGT